jgi:PleD family two-component response regulator
MFKSEIEQCKNISSNKQLSGGWGSEGLILLDVPVMRVLVVDNEVLIVLLATSWLEDLGCEVEIALKGGEALAKLGTDQHIEMLITDVNMPGLSGYQLADRAKPVLHSFWNLKAMLAAQGRYSPCPCLMGNPRRVRQVVGGQP